MDDHLDQILSTDRRLPPSPGFEATVMREVHRLADEPQPLRFPWVRFLPGLVAMFLLVAVSIVVALSPELSIASAFVSTTRWGYTSIFGTGLVWLLLGGLLSYASVRITLRSLA